MLNRYVLPLVEGGYLPDFVVRSGIRRILLGRLESLRQLSADGVEAAVEQFVSAMQRSPVAVMPEKANEQHYELPPEFFLSSLGKHLKYSCGYWSETCASLDDAESAALEISFRRAALIDGCSVLELGCGWGSMSLYMAHRLPNSRIVAVSNSYSQAQFIRDRAATRGLDNLEVVTSDMNVFETDEKFDRVVSIEMFEHMRNWRQLFQRIATWLKPDGKMFMHIFVHRQIPYFFEDESDDDWMARYFFSGGIMPSRYLPEQFDADLIVNESWEWNGCHYQKTANAWLKKMDQERSNLLPYFVSAYGPEQAEVWWQRWRLFYMACAELFGYRNGDEWKVAHFLLTKRKQAHTD